MDSEIALFTYTNSDGIHPFLHYSLSDCAGEFAEVEFQSVPDCIIPSLQYSRSQLLLSLESSCEISGIRHFECAPLFTSVPSIIVFVVMMYVR